METEEASERIRQGMELETDAKLCFADRYKMLIFSEIKPA
jgi:hypothetical protein